MAKLTQGRNRRIGLGLLSKRVVVEGQGAAFKAQPWDAMTAEVPFEPLGPEASSFIKIVSRGVV